MQGIILQLHFSLVYTGRVPRILPQVAINYLQVVVNYLGSHMQYHFPLFYTGRILQIGRYRELCINRVVTRVRIFIHFTFVMAQQNLMQDLSSGLMFSDVKFESDQQLMEEMFKQSYSPQPPPVKKTKVDVKAKNDHKSKTVSRSAVAGLKDMVKLHLSSSSQDYDREFIYNILGKLDSILERGTPPSADNFYQDMNKMRTQIDKLTNEKSSDDALQYLKDAQNKFLDQMLTARARLRENI